MRSFFTQKPLKKLIKLMFYNICSCVGHTALCSMLSPMFLKTVSMLKKSDVRRRKGKCT